MSRGQTEVAGQKPLGTSEREDGPGSEPGVTNTDPEITISVSLMPLAAAQSLSSLPASSQTPTDRTATAAVFPGPWMPSGISAAPMASPFTQSVTYYGAATPLGTPEESPGKERDSEGEEDDRETAAQADPERGPVPSLSYSSVKRRKIIHPFLNSIHLCMSLRWKREGFRSHPVLYRFTHSIPHSGRCHRHPRLRWQRLLFSTGYPQPLPLPNLRKRHQKGPPRPVTQLE
ncbi:unnamed protein product [Coccothraustes coccothraustes]